MRFENLPKEGTMRKGILYGILASIIVTILLSLPGTISWLIILPLAIAYLLLIPLIIWILQYYRRPTSVEITDGGIRLEWRFRSLKTFGWGAVVGISWKDQESLYQTQQDGELVFWTGPPWPVNGDICLYLATEFYRKTGREIPLWNNNATGHPSPFRNRVLKEQGKAVDEEQIPHP